MIPKTLEAFLCLSLGLGFAARAEITPAPATAPPPPRVFRFHLFKEPDSIVAFQQKSSNASYLMAQLFAPLLRYQDGGLKPGLASACKNISPKKVRCDLFKNLKLSDGSPLRAEDFVLNYQRVIENKFSGLAADLFGIKNAKAIFEGQKKATELGVKSAGDDRLEFELEEPDAEFLYRLTNPLLTPSHGDAPKKGADAAGTWATSGPYKFKSWASGNKIQLEPNLLSREGNPSRPPLEVLFISEDSVALKLYEAGELDFNRRLPTAFLPKYNGNPELQKIDQVRFDYFGFSPKFRERPESAKLFEAFKLGFPYDGLGALFYAKPRPGCFGIPSHWTNGAICCEQDVEKSKLALKDIKDPGFSITFNQNVDDHKRSLEWMQAEFAQLNGLKLRLDAVESKLFLERLEKGTAEAFRRGLAPDRPTCAAVLESFLPGSPENYLQVTDQTFIARVKKMRQTSKLADKNKLCREAVTWLRDQNIMIPTGPIYFSVLLKKDWQGLQLNEINQLDLKDLHASRQGTNTTRPKSSFAITRTFAL